MLKKILLTALIVVAFSCVSFAGVNTTIIDVTDYGAVPNDLNDDTTAIQNALNQGGDIYFPKGTYLISHTLFIISNSNLSGPGTLKLSDTVTINIPIFMIYNQKSRINISGLTLDGNGSTKSSGGNTGAIYVVQPSCNEISIDNVTIINARDHGIELENAAKVSITSCRITGFMRRGINITFCWDCTVEGNYLDGAFGTSRAEHGIEIWGRWNGAISAGNFVIANNMVKNVSGSGIWGSFFESSTITGNRIEQCGACGIDLEYCRHLGITGNLVKDCINGCIAISGSSYIAATGNQITQLANSGPGILIRGGFSSKHLTITGNNIHLGLNSHLGFNPYCIFADGGVSENLLIEGNTMINERGPAIRLLMSNKTSITANRIVVGNPSYQGNCNLGIGIHGGNDCIINDNLIESLRDFSIAGSDGGIMLAAFDSSHLGQRNTVTNNVIRGFVTSINDSCSVVNTSYNFIKNNRVNTIYRRAGLDYSGLIDSNVSIDNPNVTVTETQY